LTVSEDLRGRSAVAVESVRARPSLDAVLCTGIGLALGASSLLDGFFKLSVWGWIAVTTLVGLWIMVLRRRVAFNGPALVAVGALSGLWLWSYLSIGWSESAGRALIEANRWSLYAAGLAALMLLIHRDPIRLGRLLIGGATVATVAVSLYLVVRMAIGEGEGLFFGGRLFEPLGYTNGLAAYLLLSFWPLVGAAERVTRPLLSSAAVASATLVAALLVLTQSRAVLPALIIPAVLLLVAIPGRSRRISVLVAITAGVGLLLGTLVDVFPDTRPGDIESAGRLTLVVVVAIGAAWFVATELWRRRPALRQSLRALPAVAGAVLALAGTALLVAEVGNPISKVGREVDSFVELRPSEPGARFLSGSGNRYDYWRIAFDQFRSDPVEGIGAGNYTRTYYLERRTVETVTQPHSLELQVLGELGIVGALLLLAFLGAVLIALARRIARTGGEAGTPAMTVAATGVVMTWIVHSSVDWLHLFPGITGTALAASAVLLAPWVVPHPDRPTTYLRSGLLVGVSLVLAFAAFSVARTTLADHYRSSAQEELDSSPSEALDDVNRSLDLNDEAVPAYYVKAAAQARRGLYRETRATLLQAAAKEPHNHVTWGLLGDIAVRRGENPLARRYYRRASELNPKDRTLARLARDPASAAGL
jgi:hypothetical protein